MNTDIDHSIATDSFDWTQIGLTCASYRKLRQLSQAQVADYIGLKRASVANFESGRQKLPIEKLTLLTKCLGLSCELFMAKGKALNGFALIDLNQKMPVSLSPSEQELKADAASKGLGKTDEELFKSGYAISPIMWTIPAQLAVAS
jgi:transcriptional regulator with XRE-family HTH domain